MKRSRVIWFFGNINFGGFASGNNRGTASTSSSSSSSSQQGSNPLARLFSGGGTRGGSQQQQQQQEGFFRGGGGGGGFWGGGGGGGFPGMSGGSQSSSSSCNNGGCGGERPRGGFMPNFNYSFQNGEGVTGPFKNGDFGSMFDKMLEWCSTSHAHDIAKRQGIDLRDIKFETKPDGSIQVLVDAPTATPKQIEQLGAQVMEECPVARFRKSQVKNNASAQMQWLRLPDKYDR